VWNVPTEIVTAEGFRLVTGLHPAYRLMREGKFEVEETKIISNLLPRVDAFIDVGANLGYYACLALHMRKPVIAFEPQSHNLRILYKNMFLNGWEKEIEIVPMALSDRPGLLTLYGASGPSASLVMGWDGYSSRFKKTVPVSTLDNILGGRLENQRLLIKVDVEGAEYQVLRGGGDVDAKSQTGMAD
jgi:FkbM family methyltransferase